MQQVLQIAPDDPNHWNDLYVRAVIQAQTGRPPEALTLAQQALAAAPEEQKAGVQQLITQLEQQLGISPQPTSTLPFAQPAPAQ